MKAIVKTPNKGALNLRANPNGTIITQIPNNTSLDVLIDGEWAKTTYQEKEGYVKLSFLSIPGLAEITKQDLKKIYDSLAATLKTIEEVLK